jgi:hypothetical protein
VVLCCYYLCLPLSLGPNRAQLKENARSTNSAAPFQATRRRRNRRSLRAPTAEAIEWTRIACPTAPLVPAPSRRCSGRGLLAPLPSSPSSSGTDAGPCCAAGDKFLPGRRLEASGLRSRRSTCKRSHSAPRLRRIFKCNIGLGFGEISMLNSDANIRALGLAESCNYDVESRLVFLWIAGIRMWPGQYMLLHHVPYTSLMKCSS